MARILAAILLVGVAACGGGAHMAPAPDAHESPLGQVPETPQLPGDPAAGYHALVNNGYVSCGIPYSLYSMFFAPATPDQVIPGRDGENATLPYFFNAFSTKSGVKVVTANCLLCHAGRIRGQLIIGLGDANTDQTGDPSSMAELAGSLITDPTEKLEWRKWADRVEAVAPYATPSTVGITGADNIAAALFAHRDRATLAWSAEPLLELPPIGVVVPVDVPPWWRMAKKHAMFYSTAGRGDQARLEMAASALCTDSVDEAQEIYAYFNDVRAYIASLGPPAWPADLPPPDPAQVASGRGVYESNCASCHGSYAGPSPTYPNLVLGLDEVGTDPTLVVGASQFAGRFVDWFNASFYGETADLAPARGYIAPPLDGIWATAPYLHNGSVPSLATLLDSSTRPTYWTRPNQDGTGNDFDPVAVGWQWVAVDHGQAGETTSSAKAKIYDTTLLGYGNGGHTYGDTLSGADRAALIEFLKTL